MTAAESISEPEGLALVLCGAELVLLKEGALWWPEQGVLVVSDLHFEKGSSYAARGQLLPPYDTSATLDVVEALVATYRPDTVISLGDSFHDRAAEDRLSVADRARICALTGAVDWVWVEGNHDPDPPASLGGRAAKRLAIDPLVFVHEPTGACGEVAGHLHPVAKVKARGRSVRVKCFAGDEARLILPSLGAYTGGLNVRDPAFEALFPAGVTAHAMGAERIYKLSSARLAPDGPR